MEDNQQCPNSDNTTNDNNITHDVNAVYTAVPCNSKVINDNLHQQLKQQHYRDKHESMSSNNNKNTNGDSLTKTLHKMNKNNSKLKNLNQELKNLNDSGNKLTMLKGKQKNQNEVFKNDLCIMNTQMNKMKAILDYNNNI